MAQNIYDKSEFFAGYSRLPRSLHGLDGAPEWPAIRALLPSLAGKRIVDLGCGFGWFTRWASAHGAIRVLGLDLSENMTGKTICVLSDSCAAPIVSGIKKFRGEFEAYLAGNRSLVTVA